MTESRKEETRPTAPSPETLGGLRVEQLPNLSPDEAELLAKHFEVFANTTNKLVAAQQRLQDQLRVLMGELENKNQQLQSVNQELAHKIRETEEVREFLDSLIDSMHAGLIAVNGEGDVTRMNRAARRILEWKTGGPSRLQEVFDADGEDTIAWMNTGISQKASGEVRLKRKPGGGVLVRYTSVPIAGRGSSDAKRTDRLFVFEDLSEIRLLEEKLRRSDRLTALGELAAGVAHEMRNPLATMRGFLQLLPKEYEDPEFRRECSTRLIREIDRLARLTDDLLELSRPIDRESAPVDLADLVEEVASEQSESLEQAGVETRLNLEKAPVLYLDRDRIKQVLINLIVNARQAMPEGGRIEIRLDRCEEFWEESDEKTELVRLSISDDGQGVESRHLDSLFDPFFTTKDQGTGLGLALCHRIVEEHGGTIRVESSPGEGATFSLFFPVDPPEAKGA